MTVDDPTAYTKAWTVALRQQFVADTELIDEICAEARSSRSRLNEGTAQAQHGNVHTRELVKPPSQQLDQVFDNAPGIRVARFCEVCADPVGRDYQLTRGAERKRRASNDWFSNNAYGPRP